jgi:hypothetical protein
MMPITEIVSYQTTRTSNTEQQAHFEGFFQHQEVDGGDEVGVVWQPLGDQPQTDADAMHHVAHQLDTN